MKQFILSIVLFTAFFPANKIFSQCKSCTTSTLPVPEPDVMRYIGNYQNYYRDTQASEEAKNKHSVSVDFSKEAILEFYKRNFTDQPGKYTGVTIFFVTYGVNIYPGQSDDNQIGLMLVPSLPNCKADFNGYKIIQNSFDQSVNENAYTPYANLVPPGRYSGFLAKYGSVFRPTTAAKKVYTQSVRFGVGIFKAFNELFVNVATKDLYKGIRVNLAVYDANLACGQNEPRQLTLLLSPVNTDGSSNYAGLMEYFNKKKNPEHALATYNHGELCPNNCY